MDPEAAWAGALSNAWRVAHGPREPDSAESCAEALLALDGWLRGGGFLPVRWSTERERVVKMLDADTVLSEALVAARAVLDDDNDDEDAWVTLAGRVLTLNAWLSSSGALPAAWDR